jgi:hypothetical protein
MFRGSLSFCQNRARGYTDTHEVKPNSDQNWSHAVSPLHPFPPELEPRSFLTVPFPARAGATQFPHCTLARHSWSHAVSPLHPFPPQLEPRSFPAAPFPARTGATQLPRCTLSRQNWSHAVSPLHPFPPELEPRSFPTAPFPARTGATQFPHCTLSRQSWSHAVSPLHPSITEPIRGSNTRMVKTTYKWSFLVSSLFLG